MGVFLFFSLLLLYFLLRQDLICNFALCYTTCLHVDALCFVKTVLITVVMLLVKCCLMLTNSLMGTCSSKLQVDGSLSGLKLPVVSHSFQYDHFK